MNPARALMDTAAFRAATRRGPGAALLRSTAFRKLNGARRLAAAERAIEHDPQRFAGVQVFCFFIGHMKSGTSLLGSMLDAHPDVIVADEVDALRRVSEGVSREQLFHLLDRGSVGEAAKGRVTARRLGGYSFAVPGQSQGKSAHPRVIGDGRAGPTTQRLADDPTLLDRTRTLLGDADLRVIHVIRNPLDPISLSVIRGRRSLPDAIEHYFARCEALQSVRVMLEPGEVLAVRYEDVVAATGERLAEICAFLGVEATPGYLAACATIVQRRPGRDRDLIEWPTQAIVEVEARSHAFDFLAGYVFEQGVRT
ncbi:MAG: sulfotransferase [Actinomycetota bacterium]